MPTQMHTRGSIDLGLLIHLERKLAAFRFSTTAFCTPLAPSPNRTRKPSAFRTPSPQSLLEALRQIETKEKLPSPFNVLFNRYCEVDLADGQIEKFWTEIARWTFLGSPIKVVHHLAELKKSGEEELEKEADAEQRAVLSRALLLITEVVRRMRLVGDYSVKQALRRYADAFE